MHSLCSLILKNCFHVTRPGLAPLAAAAMRGHTDLVRALLERGASAQWQHPETGLTPLIAAAAGGHTDTCAALLAHKPMPRIDTTELEEGETAMLAASRFNNSLTVALLLRHGADANRMNKFGQTALIQAAMHNYTAVARALLQQRNIKIDARDKNHNTAAMVAASRGSRDVMHALLSVPKTLPNLALFRPDGATPLVLAVHANSLEIVQMMLALPPPHRPSVHFAPSVVTGKANAPTPLNVAAHLGHAHIVRALLAESPPPRADFVDSLGRVAIVSASARGHVEVRRLRVMNMIDSEFQILTIPFNFTWCCSSSVSLCI